MCKIAVYLKFFSDKRLFVVRTEKVRFFYISGLQSNLLYIPRFKKELEKFVHYPNSHGDKWSFHAPKMAKFLDDNFYLIFNR